MVIKVSKKPGSALSFKIMSLIHDNRFRHKFSDPDETLRTAGLKMGLQVLEVGCGPGFFTIPAARIVGDEGCIFAVDIHPLAIKKVQEKIKKEKAMNVKTILVNATETGLPDQSIDLVFLFGLPRFIRNKPLFLDLLNEMYRLLRINGLISIKSSRKEIVDLVGSKKFTLQEYKKGIFLFTKE